MVMIKPTHFNTLNCFGSLFNCQKPSTRWRVRKQEAAWLSEGDGTVDNRSYKKRIAVMSVSTPVMIMSLKERKYRLRYEQDMRYGLPLPRLKPSSMYMQRAKANETRNYLSYNLYEYSSRANRRVHKPVPFMRTTGR